MTTEPKPQNPETSDVTERIIQTLSQVLARYYVDKQSADPSNQTKARNDRMIAIGSLRWLSEKGATIGVRVKPGEHKAMMTYTVKPEPTPTIHPVSALEPVDKAEIDGISIISGARGSRLLLSLHSDQAELFLDIEELAEALANSEVELTMGVIGGSQ